MYKVDILHVMLPIHFSIQHWNSLASSDGTCLFLKFNICTFSLIGQFFFLKNMELSCQKDFWWSLPFFLVLSKWIAMLFFLQNTDYFTENFEDKNHFYLAVALKPLNWATFCCQCSFEDTWKIFWTAGKNSDYHLTVSQRCEYCGLFSLWLFMAYLQYNHTKSGL